MSGKGFMHADAYERNTRALEAVNKRKREQLEAEKEALNIEVERFKLELRRARWIRDAQLREQRLQAARDAAVAAQQQQQQQGGSDQNDEEDD